jgi:hypothetical protein
MGKGEIQIITFWNRKELISVSDLRQYSDARRLLIAGGIRNSTKMGGGIGRKAVEHYTIYVHEKDYDRALKIIQSEMQEEERA